MKIALLLTGQLRTFDHELVKKSWKKFMDEYDVEIFGCFWSNRGQSIFSTEQKLNDNIDINEKIEIDYVKSILNTNNITLFDYDEWLQRDEVISWKNKYDFDTKYFNPLFANSFLREESYKLLELSNKQYNSVISSRPDIILTRKPPEYLFEGTNTIWHQRYHFKDIIYSTFFSSNQTTMEKICKFYSSNLIDESIKSPHNRYNNILEHCGVMYSYIKLLNLDDKSYIGTLFAEPFRTTETLNIENIRESIRLNQNNLGMDFDKNWFPLFEN